MGYYQKGQRKFMDRIKLHRKDALRGWGILQLWLPSSPSNCQATFPLYRFSAFSHSLKERSFLQGRLINTDPQAMIRRQGAHSPASSFHIPLSEGRDGEAVLKLLFLVLSAIMQNMFRRDSNKISIEGCISNPSGSQCQAGSRGLGSGYPSTYAPTPAKWKDQVKL